jgi:hypothetical protein
MNQEDGDGDGIGDACDSNPFQADAIEAPLFYAACVTNDALSSQYPYLCDPTMEAPEGALTQSRLLSVNPSRVDLQTAFTAIGLFFSWYCQTEGCNHQCLGEFIEDLLNGREYFWGLPTRPDPIPIEFECPDRVTLGEIYVLIRDAVHEFFYGHNFPDEPAEE